MKILPVPQEAQKINVHYGDEKGTYLLEKRLLEMFHSADGRPPIILCIGTDRSTGDSLGPLIGTQLSRLKLPQLNILGTLEEPVHAVNLETSLSNINNSFLNPFIIAIDASLGRLDSVGNITLANGPLKPGAGVHKNLPEVGEAHLTGIVNVGGFMEYMVLQNTRLSLVWQMSEKVSSLISKAYLRHRYLS